MDPRMIQQLLQQYLGGPRAGSFGRNPYGPASGTSGGYSPIAGTGHSGPGSVSGQNGGNPGSGYSPIAGTGRPGPFGQGGPRLPWQPQQAQEPQALWGVKQWAPATFPGQAGGFFGMARQGSPAEAQPYQNAYQTAAAQFGQAPAQQPTFQQQVGDKAAAAVQGMLSGQLGQAQPAPQQPTQEQQEPWRPGMMPRPVEVPQPQGPVQDDALSASPRVTRGMGRRF